jgi:acylphosphatase
LIKHFKIHVTGRVQGVWYRASAQRKALELGLTGFVHNMPDGSVYAEVEGSLLTLQAFVHWCWEGPELASVENVDVQEGSLQGFEQFSIRR